MRYFIVFIALFSGFAGADENPLADRNVTCEEMEQYPEIVFQLNDLGSGHMSPTDVDYQCPKSLDQLAFLEKIIDQASHIRSPSRLPQFCTGSIIHAQWRYYHFDLAKLGYYPQGYSPRKTGKTRGMAYFEEWSYQSLYNRRIYKDYMRALEKARPLLTDWYSKTHSVSRQVAQAYADNALSRISDYGFGSYFYYWEPEELVPYTDQAVTGDYTQFLASIDSASDPQKTNSLRRLLAHDAETDVIERLASSIKTFPVKSRSEPIIANAVYSPANLQVLLDAGYPPDQQNEFGKTTLYYAVQFGQHESVEVLLAHGANVNHKYQQENEDPFDCSGIEHWGRTPLMHAAQHSDPEMVSVLLAAGADPKDTDVKGLSALDYAKQGRNPENEQLLRQALEKGEPGN